jgi:hypothetical protein
VKNLGWLLRHGREVLTIRVVDRHGNTRGGVRLIATLEGDLIFGIDFADRNVLRDWLHRRRAWRGLPLNWLGEQEEVQ